MFGIPSFLLPPEMQKYEQEKRRASTERRLKVCVPWDPKMKWEPELNLKADTYHVRNLFPECKPISRHPKFEAEPGVISPDEQWVYCLRTLQPGQRLSTWYGSKIGSVLFDGPVNVPSVFAKENWGQKPSWKEEPWMSQTPAEIISMRGGTKRAKGNVVVAGLGLGYQLIEVSQRKQVTKLTLVERSKSLVDWIYPRVKPFLGCDVDVIIDDAYKALPKLTADVALVDIFPSYGNNDYEQDTLRRTCKNIGYIWCWGAALVR